MLLDNLTKQFFNLSVCLCLVDCQAQMVLIEESVADLAGDGQRKEKFVRK